MGNKFNMVIESGMRRYQNNTLIVGDRVKFIEGYKSHDWFRALPAVKLERISDLIESGRNIRISAVKSIRPTTAETGHFEDVDGFYYDIVREEAPGLYTQVFTVPEGLLEMIDDYPNLAGKTPDDLIRKDTSQIDPKEVSVDTDTALNPVQQTGMNDGDRKLLGQNIDISVAKPAVSYTGNYLKS